MSLSSSVALLWGSFKWRRPSLRPSHPPRSVPSVTPSAPEIRAFGPLMLRDVAYPGTADIIHAETSSTFPRFRVQAVSAFLTSPPELRDAVRFDLESDNELAQRLLRARKGDADAALKLLQEIAIWRQEQRVRDLPSCYAYDLLGGVSLDELQAVHPKAYFPYPDKQGRPIYVERTGLVDAEVLNTLVDLSRLEKHHVMAYETDIRSLFRLASRARGASVSSLVTILDFEHMSLKLANASSRAYVKHMSQIDSAFYPEMLGRMLIINAPGYFSAAWAMVKGFLDERTVAKIDICSSPSAWMPKLAELIDKEHTPVEYGGSLVVPGGLFHQSLTIRSHVGAGKTLEVVSETVPAGAPLRCKWLCRPADVKFRIDFVPTGKSAAKAVASASQEYDTCDSVWVSTTVHAPAPGHFVAIWDNKSGWRARDVMHRWDAMRAGADGSQRPETADAYRSIVKPPAEGPFSAAAWAALGGPAPSSPTDAAGVVPAVAPVSAGAGEPAAASTRGLAVAPAISAK